jgi:hypothetical protein
MADSFCASKRVPGLGTNNQARGGSSDEPHAPRGSLLTKARVLRGRLKYGNAGGDPSSAPRCGARTRRGNPCLAPAIKGRRRCRMHGGMSKGPRTPEGLARSRRARWIHGRYSQEAREARREARLEDPFWMAYARQAAIRRFERESRRESRRSLAAFRAAMRRLGL